MEGISSGSTPFCGYLMVRVLKDDEKGSIEDGKGRLCVNLLWMVMNDVVEAIFEEEGQIVLGQVEGRKDLLRRGFLGFQQMGRRLILGF